MAGVGGMVGGMETTALEQQLKQSLKKSNRRKMIKTPGLLFILLILRHNRKLGEKGHQKHLLRYSQKYPLSLSELFLFSQDPLIIF